MAVTEERLARVEARQAEQRAMVDGIRESVDLLRKDMDRRFDRLDDRMTRQFHWLVGLQVLMLASLVTAL